MRASFFIRILLSLQMVFAPLLLLPSHSLAANRSLANSPMSRTEALRAMYDDMKARFQAPPQFSTSDIFGQNGARGVGLYLTSTELDERGKPKREHNRYRTGLGMRINDSTAPQPTKKMWQQNMGRLPLMLADKDYLKNQQYNDLRKTHAGRLELLRQYQWTIDALSVSRNVDYPNNQDFRAAKERARTDASKQAQQQIPEKNQIKARAALTTILVYETALTSHIENYGKEAKELIKSDQKDLRNDKWRARFNAVTGISGYAVARGAKSFFYRMGGKILGDVKDPLNGGKTTRIAITPPSKAELLKINMPQFIESVKSGTVTAGKQTFKLTLILGGLLYMINQAQFAYDYSSNPERMEKLIEELTMPGFHLGMFAFFLGGHAGTQASNAVSAIFNNTRAMQLNYHLVQDKKLYASKPIARHMIQASNVMALNYSGLTLGFIGASIVHKWVNTLKSCNQLFLIDDNEGDDYRADEDPTRPLSQARIPRSKKQYLETQCQKGFLDFVADVTTDPETWMRLLSLYNAHFLLWAYGNYSSLRATGQFSDDAARAAMARNGGKLTLLSRGLRSPLIGTLGGLAVFVVLSELTYQLIKSRYEYYTLEAPLERFKENFVTLGQSLEKADFKEDEVCKSYAFTKGFLGSVLPTLSSVTSLEDPRDCGLFLYKNFIAQHHVAEEKWRNKLMQPVSEQIGHWMNYANQMTNIYMASKLFYKDIWEQVRIARSYQQDPLEFPRTTTSKEYPLSMDDPVKSTMFHSHPLPLFRSSPFYGWDVLPEGREKISDLFPPDIIGVGVNWERRYFDEYDVNRLRLRHAMFRQEVIPKAKEEIAKAIYAFAKLENSMREDQTALAKLKSVMKLLNMKDIEKQTYALTLLSHYQSEEARIRSCNGNYRDQDINLNCPFTQIQGKFLDERIWNWNVSHRQYTFRNKRKPLFMGYQRDDRLRPFGVNPLSRGQEFLIDYDKRLASRGVDIYFHEIEDEGMEYQSMVDFLLKSMICGVDMTVEGNSLLTNEFAYNWGFSSPMFRAPRMPMRGTINPCKAPKHRGQALGNWKRGWKDQAGFYHYIEDSEDSSKPSYGGIVEYLYNEIDFDQVPDFDTWWDEKVRPDYENVMSVLYRDYLNSVVNKKVHKALYTDLESNHGKPIKNGFIASIRAQVESYFEHFLKLQVEGMPLNTGYVGEEMNDSEARQFIIAEFDELKRDYFELFEFLVGTKNELSEHLQVEVEERRTGLYDHVQRAEEVIHDRKIYHKEKREVLVVASIMREKLNDLRRLFSADGKEMIGILAEIFIYSINNDESLSGEEKEEEKNRVREAEVEMEVAFESASDRQGHVIFDHYSLYSDEAEDLDFIAPSVLYTQDIYDSLDVLTDKLASIIDIHGNMQSLNSLDRHLEQ